MDVPEGHVQVGAIFHDRIGSTCCGRSYSVDGFFQTAVNAR